MEQVSVFISSILLPILGSWWWVFLPLILYFPAKALYFYWVRWHVWYPKQGWVILELKPPKEILTPIKAMEDIFNVLWGIYGSPNWREKWCEGQLTCGSFWLSFEIISLAGDIHFFIRCLEDHRNMVESTIFAHYPEVEISLSDDYTKKVPQDIPNKEWDIYGEDYRLLKDDYYPITTYEAFFEPSGERITAEEKRLDPIFSFLESLTQLKADEQFWFQIVTAPITDKDIPWQTKGKEIVDKLLKRPAKPIGKPMIQEAIEVLIVGPSEKDEKAAEYKPEIQLVSPGEKTTITAIEKKISKNGFKTWARALYLAKRDAWNPVHRGLARSYLGHFSGLSNSIILWLKTRPKIQYWFRDRRIFVRKRRIFENYVRRLWSMFPALLVSGGTFILNSEELATIFHLPSKVVVPTLPYVEAKKKGPPPQLPIGEIV